MSWRWVRPARGLAAVLGAGLLSCTIPTDESGTLRLEFVDPPAQVLVGDTLRLETAVAGSGSGKDYEVTLISSDEEVLSVGPDGVLTGLTEGQVTVTAQLTRFEGAEPASVELFVSRGVVIAEYFGASGPGGRLRFGETLVLRGLRLDPDSLANVTVATVVADVEDYLPAGPEPGALEELRVTVPIVPDGSQLLLVHRNGGSASRPLNIVPEDVYELFGKPFTVEVPPEGFRAPWLTSVALAEDHFRFRIPAGEWTFRLALRNGQGLAGFASAVFTFQNPGAPNLFRPSWGREQAGFACDLPGRVSIWGASRSVAIPEVRVPVRFDTPTTIDFFSFSNLFDLGVPYALELLPGYQSDLPPDDTEPNDFCTQAGDLALGTPAALNLDTPGDHDWYEVEIPGTPPNLAPTWTTEQEANNGRDQAQLLTPDTRLVGENNSVSDRDWYAIDLEAGDLLDVEALGDNLGSRPPGRVEVSIMNVGITLTNELGDTLARSGYAEGFGGEVGPVGTSDARIRWLATQAGRYYLTVQGDPSFTNEAAVSPRMYYVLHTRILEPAGTLSVQASSTGADMEVVLVERMTEQDRGILLRTRENGPDELATLVPPGRYRVMVYARDAAVGDYTLTASLGPVTSAASVGGGGR